MALFDSFFMATIIPPVGVWSAIFGLSKLPFLESEKKEFFKRLALVAGALCFGALFGAFGFLQLAGFLAWLFVAIGLLVIFYSVVLYRSFE